MQPMPDTAPIIDIYGGMTLSAEYWGQLLEGIA